MYVNWKRQNTEVISWPNRPMHLIQPQSKSDKEFFFSYQQANSKMYVEIYRS